MHWLSAHGKIKEAIAEAKLAAKANRADLNIEKCMSPSKQKSASKQSMAQNLKALLGNRILFFHTVLMCYLWWCDCMIYYGLSLFSTSLSSNRYLSFCLSGLVELPAFLSISFFMEWWGRRYPIGIGHFVAGVALLALPFIPTETNSGFDLGWLILLLGLIGKFAVSSTFMGIYLYAAEIFPTTLRSVGLGLASVSARIGGILAPYVSLVEAVDPRLAPIIFGVLAMIAGVATFFLPETKDTELPEFIEDIRGLSSVHKLLRVPIYNAPVKTTKMLPKSV